MKVKNKINPQIIEAAVGMLKPYVPELSPTRLIAALEKYSSDQIEDKELKPAYTVAEVCKLLKVSKPTVYAMEKRGEIEFTKLGRLTRISAERVEAILQPQ